MVVRRNHVVLVGNAKKIYRKIRLLANRTKEYNVLLQRVNDLLKHLEKHTLQGERADSVPKRYKKIYGIEGLQKLYVTHYWHILYYEDLDHIWVVDLRIENLDREKTNLE